MVLELPESGKQSSMKAVEIQLKISEDFVSFTMYQVEDLRLICASYKKQIMHIPF